MPAILSLVPSSSRDYVLELLLYVRKLLLLEIIGIHSSLVFFLPNSYLNDSDVYSVSILKLLEGLRRASQVLKYLSKNPSESWGLSLSVA